MPEADGRRVVLWRKCRRVSADTRDAACATLAELRQIIRVVGRLHRQAPMTGLRRVMLKASALTNYDTASIAKRSVAHGALPRRIFTRHIERLLAL